MCSQPNLWLETERNAKQVENIKHSTIKWMTFDPQEQACQTGGPQLSNFIIKLLEADFRTGKSWDNFQTAARLQFFWL